MRFLLFAVALLSGIAPLPAAETHFDVRAHYTKYEFRIPMRDGKRLFTSVYVPKDTSKTYPILMTRTPYGVEPYGADNYPKTLFPGEEFERDGFIFVYQDVRGRWMSEGVWLEMTPEKDTKSGPNDVDESTDTYDTIDWLINHVPDNNGKVGMVGVSYPGFYTSAGLINAHPALVRRLRRRQSPTYYYGRRRLSQRRLFPGCQLRVFTETSIPIFIRRSRRTNPDSITARKTGISSTATWDRSRTRTRSTSNMKIPTGAIRSHIRIMAITGRSATSSAHLKNIKPAVLVTWADGSMPKIFSVRSKHIETIENRQAQAPATPL